MAAVRAKPSPSLLEARRLHEAGDAARAIIAYRAHLRQAGATADVLHWLALALMSENRPGEARQVLRRAIALAPDEANYHAALALSHSRDGELIETRTVLEAALARLPDHPLLLATLADLFYTLGRTEDAASALAPVLAGAGTHPAAAMMFARINERGARRDEAIAIVEGVLGRDDLADRARADLLFRLGALLDSAGEYDRAFHAIARANALSTTSYDPASLEAGVRAIIAEWSREAFDALPPGGCDSEVPVFIVGMPRSGTSLVEQIIASHPDAHGGGERRDCWEVLSDVLGVNPGSLPNVPPGAFTPRVRRSAGRRYVDRLRRLAPRTTRITDKEPTNFWRLGPIAACLPRARVVHCVRDPLDTCLSCHFYQFASGGAFARDLRHLGSFYRQYQRIMDHWRTIPAIQFLDLQYEALTAEQEAQSRRLLDFVELPWDDACLRFHETARVTLTTSKGQVRRPMYRSSVERWRHYEKHLEPLREALRGDVPNG